MASLSVKFAAPLSPCLGLGNLPAGPLSKSTYVSSVPFSPIRPHVFAIRRASGLHVQAGASGKKHAGKKVKKASHQTVEAESGPEEEESRLRGTPSAGSKIELPASEGQEALIVVPISQMKKVRSFCEVSDEGPSAWDACHLSLQFDTCARIQMVTAFLGCPAIEEKSTVWARVWANVHAEGDTLQLLKMACSYAGLGGQHGR